jgi:hypothetical protein
MYDDQSLCWLRHLCSVISLERERDPDRTEKSRNGFLKRGRQDYSRGLIPLQWSTNSIIREILQKHVGKRTLVYMDMGSHSLVKALKMRRRHRSFSLPKNPNPDHPQLNTSSPLVPQQARNPRLRVMCTLCIPSVPTYTLLLNSAAFNSCAILADCSWLYSFIVFL